MYEESSQKGIIVPADQITLKTVIQKFGNQLRYISAKWRFVAIAVIIGGAIGLCNSLLTKTIYTAECTFVLQENDKGGGGLSQYSTLASMAGIDVGSSSGLFQGDNITQLYRSRLMLEKTLLTPADFKGKKQLLIDKYLEINSLKTAWENNATLKNLDFNIPKSKFTINHDSIMGLIVSDIDKHYLIVDKPDKKLSMISVKVKASNQLFAKAFTEAIVSNVNSFYIQTKIKSALMNVTLLQRQADSVHRVLNSSIGTAAAVSDANPNPDPANIQRLRAPSQRKQIDVQAATAIYSEIVRNLEIGRGALQRETPLIQVIDQPVLPLTNDRVGKMKSGLTGMIIAFAIAVLWLFARNIYGEIMN